MKSVFSILLFLAISVMPFTVQGQSDLSFLPEGLHKLTAEELTETPIMLSKLPHYLEGKKISPKRVYALLTDPGYHADLYGDKNGKVRAIVIRESTEKEKKAKLATLAGPRNTPDWIGREMPPFEARNLKGERVNAEDLKGKVVVLNFWFIGCKPCIIEMPELNKLVEKYGREEVVFLAFGLDRDTKIEEFLKKESFDYTIIPSARLYTGRFGVTGYPTHFVIDREGKVQFHKVGYGPSVVPSIRKEIARLLKN